MSLFPLSCTRINAAADFRSFISTKSTFLCPTDSQLSIFYFHSCKKISVVCIVINVDVLNAF
jgi:hypothetical protein